MTGLQKNKEDTGSLTNVRKLVLKFAAMVLFAIPAAADPRYGGYGYGSQKAGNGQSGARRFE